MSTLLKETIIAVFAFAACGCTHSQSAIQQLHACTINDGAD